MPISVKHIYSNTVSDGTNISIVRPSDWNSAHALTLNLSGTDMIGGFSNLNGISFGTNPSSYITASYINDLTSGRAGVGETVGTIAGTDLAMTVDTNGVSMGYPKWITTYVNDLTSGRAGLATSFGGTNLSGSMTLNTSGLTISMSAAAPGAGGGAAISANGTAAAGSNSQNTGTVVFANSNGISFGLSNNGSMTASHNAATSDHSHGNPTLALTNLSGTTASASNGLTISLNNIDDHFKAYSLVGNTAGTNVSTITTVGTLYLSGGANITLSGNSNTIVVSAAAGGAAGTIQGGYSNLDWCTVTFAQAYEQGTSWVEPFFLPANLSFDYIRLHMQGGILAASTTAGTSASTFSCGYSKTHNFAIYSKATGANSDTLQLVVSTNFAERYSQNMGQGAASAGGQVYSNRYTYPCSSGNLGFTNDYSSTAASFNVNSASATAYTGTKIVDFPFGTSLTPGQYWLMYGASTTTAVQAAGTTIGLRNIVTMRPLCQAQAALSYGTLGAATSNIYAPKMGLGSFTTAGGGTTNSFHHTKITASAANPIMYFQLMRSA